MNYFICFKKFKIIFDYAKVSIHAEDYKLLYGGVIGDIVKWDKQPPAYLQKEVNRICKKEHFFNKYFI